MIDLQIAWFFLIGVLLLGYAILDGFDLGVGFWHLVTRDENERRLMLKSIGPFWDGNEVWLLTGGGAIFAAFPPVYATAFSAFYLPLMILLYALIFRAVALEFRDKVDSARWRGAWSWAFGLGSVIPALLYGVAVGNVMRGLPLDANGDYVGSFLDLLNPFALSIGAVGLAMFVTHGACYLAMKTEGDFSRQAGAWAARVQVVYLALFAVAGVLGAVAEPRILAKYKAMPPLLILPLLTLGWIVKLGVSARKGEAGRAFFASCVAITGMLAIFGAAIFPDLIPARDIPLFSLTLFNSSSSALTLKTMLVLAAIGMPIVIVYTVYVYRVFSGKARSDWGGY